MARMPSRPGRYGTLLIGRSPWPLPAFTARRVPRSTSNALVGAWSGATASVAIVLLPSGHPEPEVRVDLAGRRAPVQRVEVQTRRAGLEQFAGQLGGDLDAHLARLVG